MRRLQQQVGVCWSAANGCVFTLCRVHGPEIDLEPFAIALAPALVSVATIREGFEKAYPRFDEQDPRSSPFLAYALNEAQGRATLGLAVVRNAEVHDTIINDPEVGRIIGGANGSARAFP